MDLLTLPGNDLRLALPMPEALVDGTALTVWRTGAAAAAAVSAARVRGLGGSVTI